MGQVTSAALAGSIVRRIREDRGMSRAALSAATGIGTRTLYALETGESENFGLGNLLSVLDALDLVMSIDLKPDATHHSPTASRESRPTAPWDELPDIWKLDGRRRQ